MTNNDNQFDKFLRDSFQSKTFEQKAHYWEKAQNMISKSRVGSPNMIITYTISAVALITVGIALTLNSSNTELSAKQQSNSNATLIANNSSATPTTLVTQHLIDEKNIDVPANSKNVEKNTFDNSNQHNYTKAAHYTSKSNRSNTTNNATDLLVKETNEIELPFTSRKQNQNITEIRSKLIAHFSPIKIAFDTFNKKDFYIKHSNKQQRSFMVAEVGLNNYNKASINIHAGIRYQYYLTSKLAISAGLSYARINQNLTRTYQDINYGFGQQASTTTINTHRVDYIELPVALHYNLLGNHYINVGSQLGYAIQSGDKVETTNEASSVTKHDEGYLKAIHKKDIQILAGYSYIYNQRFVLTANYYYGLMDVTNNDIFKSNQFNRNSGVRFTIGYKLF